MRLVTQQAGGSGGVDAPVVLRIRSRVEVSADTVRVWCKQADIDSGSRPLYRALIRTRGCCQSLFVRIIRLADMLLFRAAYGSELQPVDHAVAVEAVGLEGALGQQIDVVADD